MPHAVLFGETQIPVLIGTAFQTCKDTEMDIDVGLTVERSFLG